MKVIRNLILSLSLLSLTLSYPVNCIQNNNRFVNSKSKTKNVIKNYDYYRKLDLSKYESELKEWYKKKTGKDLDLDNPKTFNEKIQWLKLYDSTPLKTKLADKYLVREYVKEKIGEEYLVPLLGVWDKFDDIDFNKLPNKFVLKCNHGSGWNMVVTDKSKFNKSEAKKKIDKWMSTNFAFCNGLELHYKNIEPKIIAEEYLENENKDLYDYKVMCFGGIPQFIGVDRNRFNGHTRDIFDLDWNKIPIEISYKKSSLDLNKPKNLDEIIELSKKLSEEFCLVRVDFYILNDGSIKFGELTFTPESGASKFSYEKYDKMLGDKIVLPKEKYNYHNIFKK